MHRRAQLELQCPITNRPRPKEHRRCDLGEVECAKVKQSWGRLGTKAPGPGSAVDNRGKAGMLVGVSPRYAENAESIKEANPGDGRADMAKNERQIMHNRDNDFLLPWGPVQHTVPAEKEGTNTRHIFRYIGKRVFW